MERGFITSAIVMLLLLSPIIPMIIAHPAQEGPIIKTVSLSFEQPIILRNVIRSGYDLIKIRGTELYLVPGAPMIPVKVLSIKIPEHLELERVDYKIIKMKLKGKLKIIPTPQPREVSSRERFKKGEVFVEDPRIYQSSKYYPEKVIEYRVKNGIDLATLKRTKYLIIRIFPIRYLPTTGEVEYISSMDISITYKQTQEKLQETLSPQGTNLIIITPESLKSYALQLAEYKNSTGIVTRVVTAEWIYTNYPGTDNQEKIRNFISDSMSPFVILFGDSDQIPPRYAYVNDLYVETDLYYADLDGDWDTDNDGKYGEVEDQIDGYPDILIGRLPISNANEAQTVLDKITHYSSENPWLMKILFLGTVTFGDPQFPEGEIIKDYIEYNYLWNNFSYTKLYEGIGNLSISAALNEINKGYGFVNFAGHGASNGWWFGPEGGFLSNDDVSTLTNGYKLPIVSTMACSTADWADTDVSIAEMFLLAENGGGIAYLGASDVAWGYIGPYVIEGLAGEVDWKFLASYFELREQGIQPYVGFMLANTIMSYLNKHDRSELDWYTVVEYGTLIGDPTILPIGTGDPPPPPPTPTLSGYAVDDEGRPLPNSTLRFYDHVSGDLIIEVKTSEQGLYEVVDLPPKTYNVSIERNDLLATSYVFYYPHVVMEKNITYPHSPERNSILLVLDNDGRDHFDEGVWPEEFKSAVKGTGVKVVTWSELEHGRPTLNILLHENISAVIWHLGTYCDTFDDRAIDQEDSEMLMRFIKTGGKLLLEGEDIGYEHENDTFMMTVPHAYYHIDDTGVATLEVTSSHPVTEGLPSSFNFEQKPPYPDGVTPTLISSLVEIDVNATVYNVVDGDTFDAFPIGRVRLADINAPELDEPGGPEAKDALTNLIMGREVYVDVDDLYVMDGYNRLVGVTYVKEAGGFLLNVNKWLIDNGYATITDYDNQFDPSTWRIYEYHPRNPELTPVLEVIKYSGTSYSAVIVYENKTSLAKMVYIAFPLHYLSLDVRSKLIQNSVLWLTSEPDLSYFPAPYIITNANETMIVVGASDPRGPVQAAHTIDVSASITLSYSLGSRIEVSGRPSVWLDWQICNYNETTVLRIFKAGNIITLGGLGVNLITWWYHHLTYIGEQQLAVYMAADEQGMYIYSPESGSKYRVIGEYGQGEQVTDYAMIVSHYDPDDQRYVLIIAGLSGFSTSEAAHWFSNNMDDLSGRGIILEMIDEEGDGIFEQVTIREVVE